MGLLGSQPRSMPATWPTAKHTKNHMLMRSNSHRSSRSQPMNIDTSVRRWAASFSWNDKVMLLIEFT